MPSMRLTFALIALVSLALLFGCAGSGVPQEKYDALAASCDMAKNEAASALSAQIAKTSAANSQLSSCTAQKQSLEGEQAVMEQQNSALQAQADVLAKAREKMDWAGQYNLAAAYYLDAFGPGKLPNTARMNKIDVQVALLNDAGLAAVWNGVKNCQGITGCANAKAKVIPYIGNQTQKLALDAAAIVGAKSG